MTLTSKNYVTDNKESGDIVFDFDTPAVLISDIRLMDIDETRQLLKFAFMGSGAGNKDNYIYKGLGKEYE